MKFKLHPENPRFDNEGERIVFGRLIDQLPDGADLFCNLEWIDQTDRREIDFILAIPDRGIVMLEVKGGKVEAYGNTWRQFDRKAQSWHELRISYQLNREERVLKDALRPVFGGKYPKIVKLLVTPESDFGLNVILPDMGRNMLVARNQLSELVNIAIQTLDDVKIKTTFNSIEQDLVRSVLSKIEPDYASLVVTSDRRGKVIDELSREQVFLLELLEDNPRILIRGGPGTGKTFLALEDAAEFARSGLRVGLACFNRGLVQVLKNEVDKFPSSAQPIFVGNLTDQLVEFWNITLPEVPTDRDEKQNHYDNTIPNALLTAAKDLPQEQKFDVWIVDEAQDFGPIHWEIFEASLKDSQLGIIHLFGDTNQNLFQADLDSNRAGKLDVPWQYAIARLKRNFRSSRLIASALNAFYKIDEQPTGLVVGETPQIMVVESQEQAFAAADALVAELVQEYRWSPGDIAVVTTRKLHPKQAEQRAVSEEAYWNRYFDKDEIFYTHVASFKGLERPMVVVVVDGLPTSADGKRQIYVAASRARDDLVIIGTADDLSVIGDSLEEFLEIPLS